MKKYTIHKMHKLLVKKLLSKKYKEAIKENVFIESQALYCPYYVPLKGVLGADWGVIVNPKSKNFGKLVFEHDFCGCPDSPHSLIGSQSGKDWIKEKGD